MRLRLRLSHALLGLCAVGALTTPGAARAEQPAFSSSDVPTVFFINKSDDHNRVDYGLRLADGCRPADRSPVVAYWREFEHAPPVRTHPLGWYEHVAYGISDQRLLFPTALGVELKVQLKRLPREILIVTRREDDGRCTAVARTTIAGVDNAELVSAYVKLHGPMSVDYVELRGRDPRTGRPLEERVKK